MSAQKVQEILQVSNRELSDDHSFTMHVFDPDGPVANDVTVNVWNGGDSYVYVLLNDEEGADPINPSTIEIITAPEHADDLSAPTGEGELVYELNSQTAETSDSFTYRVSDTEGWLSNTATVTLNLIDAFQTQTKFEGPNFVGEGVTATADLNGYLIYPLGFDFSTFELLETSDPAMNINTGTGMLTYDHPDPLPGPSEIESGFGNYFRLTYRFTVQNDDGIYSPPVRNEIFFTPFINSSAEVAAGAMVAFDAFENYDEVNSTLGGDFPIDAETIAIIEGPSQGTAQLDPGNRKILEYTANPGASGTDEIILSGGSAGNVNPHTIFRVIIDITEAPNGPPVFTTVFSEDTIAEGDTVEFQFQANDPDDNPLTFSLAEGDDIANASITAGGLFIFSPEAGQAGSHNFTVQVSDGEFFDDHSFIIIVIESNEPPVAERFTINTEVNAPVLIDVLSHASDPDEDELSIEEFTQPKNGTAALEDDRILYTPDEGFTGSDSFDYTVSDGRGGFGTGTVTVNVADDNLPPEFTVTFDDSTLAEGEVLEFQFQADDPNKDPLVFSLTEGDDVLNATISEDGLFLFSPETGQAGSYNFTVQVSDGMLADDHSFIIFIDEPNQLPVAEDITLTTEVNMPVLADVLSYALDPDEDELSIEEFTQPENGTAALEDDQILYTPDEGFTGSDSFVYTVSDGRGGLGSGTVTVLVEQPNRPPEFTAILSDSSLTEGEALEFQFQAEDPDDDPFVFSLTEGEEVPNASITENGLFIFSPETGQAGSYDFTVQVSDEEFFAEHSFALTVLAVNRPPAAQDITAATQINTPFALDLLDYASDPDGDSLFVVEVSAPQNGVVVLEGSQAAYTPAENVTGFDQFIYTVSDEDGETDTGLVSIEIKTMAFRVEDLGAPQGDFSRAFGISNTGLITGISSSGNGTTTGFLWSDGNFQQISGLDQAFSVNDDGVVAGISGELGGALPGLYVNGSVMLGGTLGGQFGALYSVNNHQVSTGVSDLNDGILAGMIWNGNEPEIRTLEGTDVQLFGINDAGWLAGFAQFANNEEQALIFSPEGTSQLLQHGNADGSRALGMGNNGQAAGVLFDGNIIRAALWNTGGNLEELPSLGGSFSAAYYVNNGGIVVGSSGTGQQKTGIRDVELISGLYSASGSGSTMMNKSTPDELAKTADKRDLKAVMWQDNGSIFDLNELIPAESGWELMEARSINNQLQIVGYGRFQGETRAFMLTPEELGLPVAETVAEKVYTGGQLTIDLREKINGIYGSVNINEIGGAAHGSAEIRNGYLLEYQANSTASSDTVYYKGTDGRGAVAAGKVVISITEWSGNFELHQNYPNPFNSDTVIPFQLAEEGRVLIELYDIQGRKVATLMDQNLPGGIHQAEMRNIHLASGIYLYRMRTHNANGQALFTRTRKMLLVK